MKRAMIALMLIVAMILCVSIAIAANFSAAGDQINSGNGWTINGDWKNAPASGGGLAASYTDSAAVATASHSVSTGSDGAFTYQVFFQAGNPANTLSISLAPASGSGVTIVDQGGNFAFNGVSKGADAGDPGVTYTATISSTDGKVWHVEVHGYTQDFNINAVPAKETLGISCADPLKASAMIFSANFQSSGSATPTPVPSGTPTPVPSGTPTPVPSGTPTPTPQPPATYSPPMYDPQQVQDFYNNVYNNIGSPYDTVTYNPDGTYTVTKGYPTRGTATAATFAVSGAVKAAADGVPISGASVVLGDQLQKTDSSGQYKFDGVAKGNYDIAVSAAGFASKTQSVDVSGDVKLDFALDAAAAGGASTVSAANETVNVTTTMPANATATPVAATAAPSPTQTKSPGFEGIFAALAIVGVAGALVYLNRKR